MKFSKPVYDSTHKIYASDITEGLRYETRRESGTLAPTLEELQTQAILALIPIVLESTKTWFSKPITEEWLKTRLKHTIQMPELEADFEGKITWQVVKLSISKESFVFSWACVETKADEKIDFETPEAQAPAEPLEEITDIPAQTTSAEVVGVGPTRRALFKKEVLALRARAARLLYKAETLTQEYCELYGEDTDWEDDESTDSESV